MRILLSIVLIALLSGCTTVPKSDMVWECGRMLFSHKYERFDCKRRVIILAEKMAAAGEKFDIWYGLYDDTPHVWIEQDGVILDPSQLLDDKMFYKKIKIIEITELTDFEGVRSMPCHGKKKKGKKR